MPERKPTRTADLDYFYGQSSELFPFYRIPKLLFQDSRFQPLSTDAKTLYGILLDRMSLSARNGWLDKAGRVFIIYTVQEVQDSLGCADKKATKLLRELEEYGLIERKRRGLGKPDLIYVKNFSSESSKTPYMNRDNDDSGAVQNTLQDPAKLRCNKTERNNTEVSDTDPIYSDENDWMSKRAQLEEYFSQSLEVDLLLRLCPDDEDTIYQIVDLLVDTCSTKRKMLRIAGDDKPAEVVRSRFMKLNADHDESMQRTVESVEQYGVLSPLIARPRPEGGYEIISGHRRQHAAQLAGLETLPVIVRQMDDDAAVLLMVDSNLQRENILPSERAFAYKMKLEAIERTVGRPKNVGQVVPDYFGKRSTEIVAEGTGESYKQVQRFIRLTNLIPELLDMVDEKKIAFNPAVELSYLDESQQRDFLEAMEDTQNAPFLSQAQRLKKLVQEGHFSYDVAFAVMGEEKKDELDKVVIKNDTLRKYFPRSYTPKQMEDTIIKLLDQWQRKQQRQNER